MTSTPKIYVASHRGMVGCATRIDPRYFRTTEFETLLGDPAKSKKHALLKQHGYNVNVSVE